MTLSARIRRIERILVLQHQAEHGSSCCADDNECLNIILNDLEDDAADSLDAGRAAIGLPPMKKARR